MKGQTNAATGGHGRKNKRSELTPREPDTVRHMIFSYARGLFSGHFFPVALIPICVMTVLLISNSCWKTFSN
jgi:hypothetical protein